MHMVGQKMTNRTKSNVNMMDDIKDFFLDIIYPPRCPICDKVIDKTKGRIHKECFEKISLISGPVCMRCGKTIESESVEYCIDCYKRIGIDKTFEQGKALFAYKGQMKNAMYRFKYASRGDYAVFFAEYAGYKYGDWIREKGIEAIVPVPMYLGKKKKRGYNQAEIWATKLGKELQIPVITNWVIRTKDTKPMKNLDDLEREKNLKNAFQIKENIVKYNYILLVDDIYTTGSTADAVTKCILSSGVDKVFLLSVCIGQGI